MTTKVAARRAILEGLGRGGVITTTGVGTGNTLFCADFQSSILPTDYLDRAWFHVPSASVPRQRRVTTTGLTPGTGQVAFDGAFGSSIGSGVEAEWSPQIAVSAGRATGEGPSIEGALYRAMNYLVFADETSVTITLSDAYSLASLAAWLDRSDRLVQVLEPPPISGGAPIDAAWRRWELVLDGETPRLRLGVPFKAAGGNLTLRVRRPADTWFKVSGTWTETTPGTVLASDTDEFRPDLRHCREAGLVFVYQGLAQNREGPRRAEYQSKYEAQLATARSLPMWDHTRDNLLPRPGAAAAEGDA